MYVIISTFLSHTIPYHTSTYSPLCFQFNHGYLLGQISYEGTPGRALNLLLLFIWAIFHSPLIYNTMRVANWATRSTFDTPAAVVRNAAKFSRNYCGNWLRISCMSVASMLASLRPYRASRVPFQMVSIRIPLRRSLPLLYVASIHSSSIRWPNNSTL